ncbi:serine hydrolase domain-containing protein [Dongia sedimenti]|uniref:Serine hydrolase domain-containing protein n=1 Tax=Dongia sedimenti TaxID=3064282 RepID=A0ABU0YV39_9PROT|nr:serine hydrolase domain-containing protein [Rhodospirillaceae bacterium R-7]
MPFATDLERKLAAGIESGLLRHLHAVLVGQHGRIVLERYDRGPDEAWGAPLGEIDFGPDTLHDLRSVTKSIVGLLYGIALDRGLVPPPEAPLFAQFPDYPDLAGDPARAGIRVEHALSMTLGLEWDEFTRPYTDPANSEIAMENAPDRYRFILERPITGAPGARWTYSGGAVALMGALIARGSGRKIEEFAREALFKPLGIADFTWSAGRDGIASAASGLRLTARDLMKIGALLLDGGLWQGNRVVSEDWIEQSFRPRIETGDGWHYGRLWFLDEAPIGGVAHRWIGGLGNGGQRLWLQPETGIAAVIFSGSYNVPDSWVTPMRVWREIVLANFSG